MSDQQLTLVEHLAELRRRIIVCLVSVFIGAGVCYFYSKQILEVLIRPIGDVVFIAPQEAFVTFLKISVIAGFFVALPVIIYQVWSFVSEGLHKSERKHLLLYAPVSLILFLGGASFVYFIILPLGVRFLLGFATETLKPMISVSKYVSFAGMLIFVFGIVFELPLVIMFLTKIRVVNPSMLKSNRKYSILIIFIVAALLTPPDVVTQVLLAGPLIVLYELSILLSKLVHKP